MSCGSDTLRCLFSLAALACAGNTGAATVPAGFTADTSGQLDAAELYVALSGDDLPPGAYWWIVVVDDDVDGVPAGDPADFVVTVIN